LLSYPFYLFILSPSSLHSSILLLTFLLSPLFLSFTCQLSMTSFLLPHYNICTLSSPWTWEPLSTIYADVSVVFCIINMVKFLAWGILPFILAHFLEAAAIIL
jgi:hypothetical protein